MDKQTKVLLVVVLLGVAGFFAGTIWGWTLGVREIQSITEGYQRQHPGKGICGTGFPGIVLGITMIGSIAGTLGGVLAGTIVWYKWGSRRPRKKSDWAAYYGQ